MKPKTSIIIILTFIVALVACTPTRPVEREGGVLAVALPSTASWVDPHRAAYSTPLLQAVYDTLAVRDAEHVVHPSLAESWTVSPDGSEIVMQIREGVVFHDGTRLDAQAVVANIERIMSGDADVFPVRKLLGPLREVRSEGLRLTLVYDKPYPPVWSALTDARLGIVSPASLGALDAAIADDAHESSLPSGSGPYQLSDITATVVDLERYAPYAWPPGTAENQGAMYPNTYRVLLVTDEDEALGTEPDLLWWPPSEVLPAELAAAATDWRSLPFGGTRVIYLALVVTVEPFDDPLVRQAVAWLADRDAALRHLPQPLMVTEWPFSSYLVPASPAAAPANDPVAAVDLLARTGWEPADAGMLQRDGEMLTIRLATYAAVPAFAAVAADLAEQWRLYGIACELVPGRRFLQPGLVTGEPNAWLLYYDWYDPDVAYYLFHSSQIGQANRSGLSDEQLDQLLAQGRAEMNPVHRHAAYREAGEILLRWVAVVPLAQAAGELRISTRVVGWAPQAPGVLLPHDLYLRDAPGR